MLEAREEVSFSNGKEPASLAALWPVRLPLYVGVLGEASVTLGGAIPDI